MVLKRDTIGFMVREYSRMPTLARPDLEGLDRSIQPIDVVVKELRDSLGAKLVAYITSVTETRAVHAWADGSRKVRDPDAERRLRTALQIAVLLGRRDEPMVVQAWFQGLNPKLSDRSPARLLREGDIDRVGPKVLAAARAFSAVG